MVKLSLSTRKSSTGAYVFINFSGETLAVYFETAKSTKTAKVLPIKTYHVYGIVKQQNFSSAFAIN